MQTIDSTQPNCAFTSFELLEASTGISSVKIGNDWFVVPDDKSIHAVYTFKVKVTADGGATVTTNSLTLNVGCSTAVITQNTGFSNSKSVEVGSSSSGVYTYAQPTVNPAYCAGSTNSLMNVNPAS